VHLGRFRHRLNDAIFEGGGGTACTGVHGAVRAFDGAIPRKLLSQLQSVFAPSSDFWDEHAYPTDQFFSYNQRLEQDVKRPTKKQRAGTDGAAACEKPAGGALLQQLAEVLLPLAGEFVRGKASVESFEWWAHKRRFDMNPRSVRENRREALTSPASLVAAVAVRDTSCTLIWMRCASGYGQRTTRTRGLRGGSASVRVASRSLTSGLLLLTSPLK
jgi:hypothetical protein